jgi:hypothetical protein
MDPSQAILILELCIVLLFPKEENHECSKNNRNQSVITQKLRRCNKRRDFSLQPNARECEICLDQGYGSDRG